MLRILFLFCGILFSLNVQTAPLKPENIPEPLKPWTNWVLNEETDYRCPAIMSIANKICPWQSRLQLNLNAKQGEFHSQVQLYSDSWIALPGDNQFWPLNVTINQQPAMVMLRDQRPMVKLSAGIYHLQGQFLWDHIPEQLAIPISTGLIELSIYGKSIPFPTLKAGTLWLKESDIGIKKLATVENKIDMQIFRHIDDTIPLQLTTLIELEVSGETREIHLSHALLNDFIPIQLQTSLPAHIENNGHLSVQVRPGKWQIELKARYPKPLNQLGLNFHDSNWVNDEIWVFNAQPQFRLVEIETVNTIDPSQTNLPQEWKHLPAYQIHQGQQMQFKVLRRGDPEPEPNQLQLNRQLWLDFNGKGYTIQDNITGKMSQQWQLTVLPEIQLGQVKLNGDTQLITQLDHSLNQGVEIRQGQVKLIADSRLVGSIQQLNAVGWQQNFHQVTTQLNLPPGWKLLAVSGVDNQPDCWLNRWSLLDFFLVLMIAFAVTKLWNIYWGIFSLISMILIWQETDAPQWIWLHLLASISLIRLVPQGKLLSFLKAYHYLSLLLFVLITFPFLIQQFRLAIYPQLEKPEHSINTAVLTSILPNQDPKLAAAAPANQEFYVKKKEISDQDLEEELQYLRAESFKIISQNDKSSQPAHMTTANNFKQIDANANLQTGFGIPQWQWNQVTLTWNGSVDFRQSIHLWYLTPLMNQGLNLLRILTSILLALLIINFPKIPWQSAKRFIFTCVSLMLILPGLFDPNITQASEMPSKELLNELKKRLTQAPDCVPNCVDIAQLQLQINPEHLSLNLQIQAQESLALPLPAQANQWFPNQVLVDGQPATALIRDDGGLLWISLEAGQHQVLLSGNNPPQAKFTLPLNVKPHHVEISATGWSIEGVADNGKIENQLQFNRLTTDSVNPKLLPLEQEELPPFIQIERRLALGLDWRLTTKVTRVLNNHSAVVLEVPLLSGESVTTPNIRVKNAKVQVNLSTDEAALSWESILEKTPQIQFVAAQNTQWTEIWRADISPMWHVQTQGIAVVHHQDQQGYWLPEWRPWAGEKLDLHISRPQAVKGRTLTLDQSHLTVTQGKRSQDVELNLQLHSSKAGLHTLKLPVNAQLQSVSIQGVNQPIRQQGQLLTLPIKPGEQQITIQWQQLFNQSWFWQSPMINLGMESVNYHLTVHFAEDRWLLWLNGSLFGPAILFWGLLGMLFIVSIGLAKIPLTPLSTYQWFFLLIGLSQIELIYGLIVIIWLFLLGWKAQSPFTQAIYFNLLQVSLVLLTLISLTLLFVAVNHGLLQMPEMQIMGNHSSATDLNWYQDRIGEIPAHITIISIPLWAYRLLMLLWALWLASALISWLTWAWQCFAVAGFWKRRSKIVL